MRESNWSENQSPTAAGAIASGKVALVAVEVAKVVTIELSVLEGCVVAATDESLLEMRFRNSIAHSSEPGRFALPAPTTRA